MYAVRCANNLPNVRLCGKMRPYCIVYLEGAEIGRTGLSLNDGSFPKWMDMTSYFRVYVYPYVFSLSLSLSQSPTHSFPLSQTHQLL